MSLESSSALGFVRRAGRSIDGYWFGHGSPTTLGVFRILIGSLGFLNLLMIATDWETWFGESGFVPAWLGSRWIGPPPTLGLGTDVRIPRINLLGNVTDPRLALALYALITLAALFTALGLWTRVSAMAFAIGMVSLHHRNTAVLHGGDTVLRNCCLYLAVAPCGRACSLDRLIALRRGIETGTPVQVSLWAQRLVSYNVALIYGTTCWVKWFGDKWKNGTATWYPARLTEFTRFPVPRFFNELPLVYVTTYGTLIVEFSLATLVFFRPWRKYVLLAGLMLHGYIDYSMNIPLFSYLMTSMYVSFFDGEEVSGWAERLGMRLRRWHVTVRIPSGTRLKPSVGAFLDSADPLKMVSYLPGERETWEAFRLDGSPIPARRAILTRSLGLWVFGWMPGMMGRLLRGATEGDAEAAP